MSKSPKWLVNSSPGSKHDIFRTRVLVPVRDGLVELFSFTMVNKLYISTILFDGNFIKCVLSIFVYFRNRLMKAWLI